MDFGLIATLAFVVLLVAAVVRVTRRKRHVGSAGAGAVYDLLNEDKRKAIEIIVEERAEARDPEDAEGDLPQLEKPGRF